MSFAANLAAVICNLFKSEKPSQRLPLPELWLCFENKQENMRVDFNEKEGELLRKISVGEKTIFYQGHYFKLIGRYWYDENGNKIWEPESLRS